MPKVHFQSIYRRFGLVICEPLCEQEIWDGIALSPLKHEVTCEFCLRFLTELKESSHA